MKKIYVAGHNGMVGSAICRKLRDDFDVKVIVRERKDLDLCNQSSVNEFLKTEKPDEIIIAAARVGGIEANNLYPANFIYENLQIQNNLINGAHLFDIQKLLFLGSSCIYPKFAAQPINENSLLTGILEPTNEPYAIAKIAGIKMCESYNRQFGRDYRPIMPTNLYGPGDNYDHKNSHVIPALIRRFHEAKLRGLERVVVWGTGKAKREFLFVDDMAEASLLLHYLDQRSYKKITKPMLSHVNVGTGLDISINQLARTIKNIVGFKGEITFDSSKPDGTPRKVLNIEKLSLLDYSPKFGLEVGLMQTYKDFLESY